MALLLGWYRPESPRKWPELFEDTDFCALTDMTPVESRYAVDSDGEDDEDDELRDRLDRHRRPLPKLLQQQRAVLSKRKLSPQLPLFRNIAFLAELLELGEADRAVLTFAVGLKVFPQLEGAIAPHSEPTSTTSFGKLFARITGARDSELLTSLSLGAPLVTTGLVKVNRNVCDLHDKVTCMAGLEDILLMEHADVQELMERFLRRVAAPSLTLGDFPHLRRDSDLLAGYLSCAVSERTPGVNILIHGKPGVGKNQFVQALADELQVTLYEVFYADKEGDPIRGEDRLRAYALCQRFLSRSQNAMLLFDEVEDVFQGGNHNFFSMLFRTDDEQSDSNGKAWINSIR